LIIPAPNSTRKRSQRKSKIRLNCGVVVAGPRKIARKPASRSNDSHPKE